MRWIRNYTLYKESTKFKSKTVINELCISMLLINPSFLDGILDKGMKGRYTDNSSIFLNDLRTLVFGKNRLKCGRLDEECNVYEEEEVSKINNYFSQLSDNFDIEKDWNTLVKARNVARNIQDKLMEDKLTPEMIKNVYWLGPNKERSSKIDIVVETTLSEKYAISVNSKVSLTKSQSFNTFASVLVGEENLSLLHSEENKSKWDKLVQEWVKSIYENSHNNYKLLIEKFIDPDRIYGISWDNFFNIKHSNDKYKHLGEYIEEFDKNILYLYDLLNCIYKEGNTCIEKFEEVKNEWLEIKIMILNSRIIEHLYTESFKKIMGDDKLKKSDSGYYIANDKLKMRIIKTIADVLKMEEIDVYYFGTDDYSKLPKRDFFRLNFDDIDVEFQYHVNLTPQDDEEDSDINDSQFDVNVKYKDELIFKSNLSTDFSGGELTHKLNTKVKVEFGDRFKNVMN